MSTRFPEFFKPMLARPSGDVPDKTYNILADAMGYAQPKLDGVRLIWDGKNAYSRNGKPIAGVPGILEILRDSFSGYPLDGELYSHGRSFQSFLGSVRRTKNIEEDVSVMYWVYDFPFPETSFRSRWLEGCDRLAGLKHNAQSRIRLTPTFNLHPTGNASELKSDMNAFQQRFVSEGYEGAMYRAAYGLYAPGKRSDRLLKFKSFIEEEFEIIGSLPHQEFEKDIVPPHTPGAKQYADGTWYKNGAATQLEALGALRCRTDAGAEFDVGSGFSDALRNALWAERGALVGKRATVKYFEHTDAGVPRFPTFKAIRDYE